MAKQTAKDRAQRLAKGCCPIHGLAMTPVGNAVENGEHLFVAGCPRRDCKVQGTTPEPFGPVKLLPAFQHLLGPVALQ